MTVPLSMAVSLCPMSGFAPVSLRNHCPEVTGPRPGLVLATTWWKPSVGTVRADGASVMLQTKLPGVGKTIPKLFAVVTSLKKKSKKRIPLGAVTPPTNSYAMTFIVSKSVVGVPLGGPDGERVLP